MEQRPSHRSCGPCTACCKPFLVEEVQKLDAHWCQHRVAGTGSAIYKDRPPACKLYSCTWLAGKGDELDRPDLCGFMMDMSDSKVGDRDSASSICTRSSSARWKALGRSFSPRPYATKAV